MPAENAEPEYEPSGLPSVRARYVAFAAILIAGACGALIGFGVADAQCRGDCGAATGIGAIVGAVGAAGGVSVVAVLALRAMGEWRAMQPPEE